MTATTAASLMRQLDARRTQAQIAVLADLGDAALDEVRRLLGSVKPQARVDVAKLVASVRDSIAERIAQRPPGESWRYALSLMDDGQIAEFRKLVESGTDPDAAASRAMKDDAKRLRPTDDVEPADPYQAHCRPSP